MRPKAIDLFAGAGGLSLGFEMAGFDVLLAVEYDSSIADAYKLNHPYTKVIAKDIKKLSIKKTFSEYIGKIDIVFGGPPCQGFSQKGQRRIMDDERNYLFKYFVMVVKFLKPSYFVMENVPTILTTGQCRFKKEIEAQFKKYEYNLEMGVLNAADYGVPQSRRRAVIIGKLRGASVRLPKALNRRVTIWNAISDLSYLNSGEGAEVSKYRFQPKNEYQKKMRKGCRILYNHIATKHSALAIKRLKMIPPNRGKEVLPKEHLTKSIYSGTWTRMIKNEISVTITTRFDTPSSGKFTHPYLHRAITVREAARIQSFPDNFHFIGTKGSQMKQVGNAVPPLLAYALAKCIKNDMKSKERKK